MIGSKKRNGGYNNPILCRKLYHFPNEYAEKIRLKTVVLRNKEHMYSNDGWMLIECKQNQGRFFPANFLGMILRVSLTDADGNENSSERQNTLRI